MAVMVSTRLWLGADDTAQRDLRLVQRLAAQIRRVALERPLLLAVDGRKSYVRAFRLAGALWARTPSGTVAMPWRRPETAATSSPVCQERGTDPMSSTNNWNDKLGFVYGGMLPDHARPQVLK
jgi:hypothetical protein